MDCVVSRLGCSTFGVVLLTVDPDELKLPNGVGAVFDIGGYDDDCVILVVLEDAHLALSILFDVVDSVALHEEKSTGAVGFKEIFANGFGALFSAGLTEFVDLLDFGFVNVKPEEAEADVDVVIDGA